MPIYTNLQIKSVRENDGSVTVEIHPTEIKMSALTEKSINTPGGYKINISDDIMSGEHYARVKLMYNDNSIGESAVRQYEDEKDCYMIMSASKGSLSTSNAKECQRSLYWYSMAMQPEISKYIFGSEDPKDANKTKEQLFDDLKKASEKFIRKVGEPINSNKYKKEATKIYKERNNGEEPRQPFAKKGINL